MTTTSSITVNFSGPDSSSTDNVWVKLEQIIPPNIFTKASLKSVHKMWVAAATGGVASLMRIADCPIQFTGGKFEVTLGFYAWPSSPKLPYTIGASIGSVTPGVIVEVAREFSVLVSNNDTVSLPYYMDGVDLTWETPVFDAKGTEIPEPIVTQAGNLEIKLSTQAFGVVRIKGKAIGEQYNVAMTFDKTVATDPAIPYVSPYQANTIIMNVTPEPMRNSPKIENIENTITATWDEGDTVEAEQLRLEVPQCVKDILALCPDMFKTYSLLCKAEKTLYVYFNACEDDEVLYCIPSDAGTDETTSVCSDVSDLKRATVHPWGVIPTS